MVSWLVFFCNSVNVLEHNPNGNAPQVKIQIWGYLQICTPRAVTALENLLPCLAPLFPAIERAVEVAYPIPRASKSCPDSDKFYSKHILKTFLIQEISYTLIER